jgi:hypothetical protein
MNLGLGVRVLGLGVGARRRLRWRLPEEGRIEGRQFAGSRDENGAETDGTKCCHICFHIFMRKQKRKRKHRK